jgi:DNA (cytosine-5)-methyltransferase 1
MLDLFCGAGLAAWGYWRSGRFSEIVGVDVDCDLRDRYAFDFIHADALTLDYEFLMQFDFIHASPPCQFYSKATPDRAKHMRLIPGTHLMLHSTGVPYVIENVEGSGHDLRPNLIANGLYFGLVMDRPRLFHISTLVAPQRFISRQGTITRLHGGTATRQETIPLPHLVFRDR